jgi:diguanylate cyclase (GGDEF)-like protein
MIPGSFEELKHTGDLPSPSGVGMRILVLTQQEDCSLDDIVKTIQADPALTGRIIKLASSVQYGSSVTVATAREAALRLGFKAVCNVSLGFTLVAGNRSGRCAGFDYDRYWSWSLANAAAAAMIAAELNLGDAADAFTCGLLVRIGELALASVHPSDYTEVLARSRRPGGSALRELERSRFQIDHAEATAAMLTDWGLPGSFAQASVAYLDEAARAEVEDPHALRLLSVMLVSGAFADYCLASDEQHSDALRNLSAVCALHSLSQERTDALAVRASAQWKEWGEILSVPTQTVPIAAELRARLDTAEATQAAVEEVRSSGLRILAVDDDAVSLRLLERHLQAAGHTVVTATNGKQAMAAALETNPQLVITDWMMPEMNGLQFCKALRRFTSGRGMYVLLLTGRGEEERIVEAFDAGVDDYIVKPFKPKLLLARIRAGIRVVELQNQVELDKKLQREQLAKLAVLNRKLRAAALTDPLTELPNRRYAMKRLETEWSTWRRTGQPLSVLMVDIDHFKYVNDDHGHDVGDTVLREITRAMCRTLRRSDTCARIGGEEFLVISPNTDREGGRVLAERIREEVESTTLQNGSFAGSVTVSVGLSTLSVGSDLPNVEALLKLVDLAIYQAKKAGRNRWAEGHPPDQKKTA